MSATSARASRRDLRRAFGESAVQTINNQADVIQSVLLPRVMTLGQTAAAVDHRLGALETTASETTTRVAALEAFRQLPFLARLRWLVGF